MYMSTLRHRFMDSEGASMYGGYSPRAITTLQKMAACRITQPEVRGLKLRPLEKIIDRFSGPVHGMMVTVRVGSPLR